MEWHGKWIWEPGGTRREWNRWLQFRKEFELRSLPRAATLSITADAKYTVWLNGERIGQGPIRGFPEHWKYDRYEVTERLRLGRNCIAVLAYSLGISTFQYIVADAGVRAQLDSSAGVLVATGASWRVRRDPPRSERRFRTSCQQGWQEVLVHVAGEDWRLPGYDDGGWGAAVEVADNRRLAPAEVGLVGFGPVVPAGVVWSRTVRPPATAWSLALREALLPGYTGAAPMRVCGLVGVVFHVKQPERLVFELRGAVQPSGRLNGRSLEVVPSRYNPWEAGIALIGSAKEGRNFVIFDVTGVYHEWYLQVVVDDMQLDGPPGAEFLIAGPFQDPADFADLMESKNDRAWRGHPSVASAGPEVASRAGTAFTRTAYAKTLSELPAERVDPSEILLEAEPGADAQVLLDLGRMAVGYWSYKVESELGGALSINGFECLQEGVPDFCWEVANTIEHQVGPARLRHESPQRRGGRYVLLQGRDINVRDFQVIEATYPSRQAGAFRSSDPVLNGIYEMCALTMRLCSEDTFVDCPTYEQAFWVGDARNESLINFALFGDWALARRCWLLAAESLNRSPMVESHVPSGWPMIIPAWSFLWAMGCWEYYFYTADRAFLEAIYSSMVKQLRYAESLLTPDGLLSIEAWNLCDWAPMDQPGVGVVTHNQGWMSLSAEATAQAAETLGCAADAVWARAVRHRIAEACNGILWNEVRQAYTDCLESGDGGQSEVFSLQTQCVLSLAEIPTGERQERIVRLLTGVEPAEGFVQIGTPFFMFFLMEMLERMGREGRVLEEIRKKWGMMLDRGAATCWEVFAGFMKNGRWTRSHCHAWSAAPGYFLSRHQLGIVPTAPGFTKARFRPLPFDLTECSGAVPTPHGPIRVEWTYRGGRFDYAVEAPPGVEIVYELPESV